MRSPLSAIAPMAMAKAATAAARQPVTWRRSRRRSRTVSVSSVMCSMLQSAGGCECQRVPAVARSEAGPDGDQAKQAVGRLQQAATGSPNILLTLAKH